MESNFLNGIGNYLLFGQEGGINSYFTSPYLSGMYSSGTYLSGERVSGVFQSGVRFGQALEKAMEKNPESAEELRNILKEAFENQSGRKTTSAGNGSPAGNKAWSGAAAVYEPSGGLKRTGGDLKNYLAGRRAARVQQRRSGTV